MNSVFLPAIFITTTLFAGCQQGKNTKPSEDHIIYLMKKKIYLDQSQILFKLDRFSESDLDDWDIHHSEWWVADGWLFGRNPGNHPGMIILKKDFQGNVLVEFEASTISPSTHDINIMWNGEWVDSLDQRGIAYVTGLEGWWTGKVGIEKSPDYKFMLGTPLFNFQPGKIYKIQAGSINGHCFVLADGQLLLEGMDPDPIDNTKFTKVGLEAYSSFIKVKNITIRKINWEPVEMKYDPEF